MPLKGSCHCGAVRIEVPSAPEWVGSCNCSICRKLGWLVAYYPDDGSVRVEGETATYIQGDRMIRVHHCPVCACATHWDSNAESYGRIGVGARLLDGFAIDGPRYLLDGAELEVRYLDNASS